MQVSVADFPTGAGGEECDWFITVASDGVWDALTSEEAAYLACFESTAKGCAATVTKIAKVGQSPGQMRVKHMEQEGQRFIPP